LQRLLDEKKALVEEQTELSKKVPNHSRIRKSEVEEFRKRAIAVSKQRNEANNDPRKKEIPTEIRHMEDKVDKIKRLIEDEKVVLDTLRLSQEAMSSISVLEEQCAKDLEGLEEALRDHASSLHRFNIPSIKDVSLEGDDDGGELVKRVGALTDTLQTKYRVEHAEVSRSGEELARAQQIVSEKTALLLSSQQTVTSLKPKLERVSASVEQVKKVVQDLRRHETSLALSFRVTEEAPRELINYLNDRLVTIEEEAPVENAAQTMKKLFKRLNKLAKIPDASSPAGCRIQCPCCKRGLSGRCSAVQQHDAASFQ
jgi:DNA repair protein RAD50